MGKGQNRKPQRQAKLDAQKREKQEKKESQRLADAAVTTTSESATMRMQVKSAPMMLEVNQLHLRESGDLNLRHQNYRDRYQASYARKGSAEEVADISGFFNSLAEISGIYKDLNSLLTRYQVTIKTLLDGMLSAKDLVEIEYGQIWSMSFIPLIDDIKLSLDEVMLRVPDLLSELVEYKDPANGKNFMHHLLRANIPISYRSQFLIEKFIPRLVTNCIYARDHKGITPCDEVMGHILPINIDCDYRVQAANSDRNGSSSFLAKLLKIREEDLYDSYIAPEISKQLSLRESSNFVKKTANSLAIMRSVQSENATLMSDNLVAVFSGQLVLKVASYSQALLNDEEGAEGEVLRIKDEVFNDLARVLQTNSKYTQAILFYQSLGKNVNWYRTPLYAMLGVNLTFGAHNLHTPLTMEHMRIHFFAVESIVDFLLANGYDLLSVAVIQMKQEGSKDVQALGSENLLFQLLRVSGDNLQNFTSGIPDRPRNGVILVSKAVEYSFSYFILRLSESKRKEVLNFQDYSGETMISFAISHASPGLVRIILEMGCDDIDFSGKNSAKIPPLFLAIKSNKFSVVRFVTENDGSLFSQIYMEKAGDKYRKFDLLTFYIYQIDNRPSYEKSEATILADIDYLLGHVEIQDKDFLRNLLTSKKLNGTDLAEKLSQQLAQPKKLKAPKKSEVINPLIPTPMVVEETQKDRPNTPENSSSDIVPAISATQVEDEIFDIYNFRALLSFALDKQDAGCYDECLRLLEVNREKFASEDIASFLNLISTIKISLGSWKYEILLTKIHSLDKDGFVGLIETGNLLRAKVNHRDTVFIAYLRKNVPDDFDNILQQDLPNIIKYNSVQDFLWLGEQVKSIESFTDLLERNIVEVIYILRSHDSQAYLVEYLSSLEVKVQADLLYFALKASILEQDPSKHDILVSVTQNLVADKQSLLAYIRESYQDSDVFAFLGIDLVDQRADIIPTSVSSSSSDMVITQVIEKTEVDLDEIAKIIDLRIAQKYSQVRDVRAKILELVSAKDQAVIHYAGSNVSLALMEEVMSEAKFTATKRRNPNDLDIRFEVAAKDFYHLTKEKVNLAIKDSGFIISKLRDTLDLGYFTFALEHKDSSEKYDIIFYNQSGYTKVRPQWNVNSLYLDVSNQDLPSLGTVSKQNIDEMVGDLSRGDFKLCSFERKLAIRCFGAIRYPIEALEAHRDPIIKSIAKDLEAFTNEMVSLDEKGQLADYEIDFVNKIFAEQKIDSPFVVRAVEVSVSR